MNRNKQEDINILRRYFKDDLDWEALTDHQRDKAQQIRSAYTWLLEAWAQADIVKELEKDFDVSTTTAYRVIRNTEIIFGSLRRANKDILRQIAISAAKEALYLAKKAKDYKAIAGATKLLSDVGGLNTEDPDMPDFEKLQPSLIVTVLPEGMEAQLQRMLGGGAIDFNNFLPPITPHEDVTNDTGTTD